MSGADAIRHMRGIDPAVPIVLCSGFPRDDRAGGVTLGQDYNAFLPKPFRRNDIADILARTARRV